MSYLDDAKVIAARNALKYGKADVGKVIQKLIGIYPEIKKNMAQVVGEVKAVVQEVNSLSKEELAALAPKQERKKEERSLSLPNAEEGGVKTRFAPEPSGYLHIGHAKAATLNYEAARSYNGEMLLRFDDTNPEKATKEYEEAIREDLSWLGIEYSSITYTSDKIEEMYSKLRRLISLGKAYVCLCSKEQISEYRREGRVCSHREQDKEKNLSYFEAMMSGAYGEGEALLRYKGDMASKNTAMRDPTLARIILSPHYRKGKKYRVWPSYDFAVVFMDAEEGITHAIRSKEYELRGELYYSLLRDLGYGHIELIHISRLFIPGYPISKRDIRKLIEEGKIASWDDPRLLTLRALKRRGILPEALRKFGLSFGLGKQENPADLELLLKENRKLLDKRAERYFFVPEPVPLKLEGDFPSEVELKKHPSSRAGGRRLILTSPEVLIPKSDWERFEDGELVRLKDFINVVVDKKSLTLRVAGGETKGLPKVQWLPKNESIEAKVLVPKPPLDETGNFKEDSLEEVSGLAEANISSLDQGSIVQFERFGFVRLDDKEKMEFIFSC